MKKIDDIFLLGIYIISLYVFEQVPKYFMICNGLLGVLTIKFIWNSFQKKIILNLYMMAFLSFMLLNLSSIFWAIDIQDVVRIFFRLIPIFLILMITINVVDNRKKVMEVIKYIFCGGTITSILLIYNQILNPFAQRNTGDLGNANQIGIQIGIALACGIFIFFISRKFKYKVISLSMCLANIIGIFLTGSRSSLIFPLIYIFLYFGIKNRKKIAVNLRNTVFLVIVILFINYLFKENEFLYKNIGRRVESLFKFLDGQKVNEGSVGMRSLMIRIGLEGFSENPILGVGGSNFSSLLQQSIGIKTYSHNNFVEIASGLGILGIISYYGIYIISLYQSLVKFLKFKRYMNLHFFCLNFSIILLGAISSVLYYRKLAIVPLALGVCLVGGNFKVKRMER